MERRRGPVVDGTSRFLSILAILLGIGGGIYLYQENQALKETVANLKGNDYDTLASTISKDAQDFNVKWNQQLTNSLQDFTDRADQAIQRENRERTKRNDELKKIVEQLRVDRVNVKSAENSLKQLESFVYAPKLRVARTSGMFAGIDPNFVMINNEGLASADVVGVSFHPRPNGQFKTSEDEVRAATNRLADNESVVIEFTKDHNRAAKRDEGLHRHYQRPYQQGVRQFPGNKTVPLSVLIYNSDHRGWGWEGAMEIVYANGRSLFVPSVRAVFVPSGPLDEI